MSLEEPAEPDDEAPTTTTDPVAVVALGVGFLGVVVAGIVCAIVAAILGAVAGQRARERGDSLETAYLVMGMAAVDGVIWVVLHSIFYIPLVVG